MDQKNYLSIVIPAYKEEERIHKILDAICDYVKLKDFSVEVIVVVDGSKDKTAEKAKEYENKIKNYKVIDRKVNMGKGYTVKEGVLAAEGEYILFTDADNSTPVEQVDKLLEYRRDYDVIIGSRYIKGAKLTIPQSLFRKTGSRFLNFFIQSLAVSGIRDTQCGFKLFSKKAAKEIFEKQTFNRFSFDIELLAVARSLGYLIKEVGITWHNDPHSLVSPIKDGFRMIRDAWKVRKNILAKKYSRI